MAGHGCYFLLLTYCWDSKGPLPLDEERIAGICEARSQDERHTMQRVLHAYFVKMADGWYNRRMQREIERSHAIGLARKAAGAKGYLARVKQLPGKRQAIAGQVPLPSPPPPLPEVQVLKVKSLVVAEGSDPPLDDKKKTIGETHGTRLPRPWELPEEWLKWALNARPDFNEERILRESLIFRDHWHSKAGKDARKADWRLTWYNWIRRAK